MKKSLKRAMSFLLTATLLIGSMNLLLNVSAATVTYAVSTSAKKTVNPDESVPFSFQYFDTHDYSFKYMTNKVSDNNGWQVTDVNGTLIKSYTQSATRTEHAVLNYKASKSGLVKILNGGNRQIASRYETNLFTTGEIMIVQKSFSGYAPIWPDKGEWNYAIIPQKTSSSDTVTKLEWPSNLTAYVESGDEILVIIRSSLQGKRVSVNIQPDISFDDSVADTDSLRPVSWDSYYKGADDQLPFGGKNASSGTFSTRENVDTDWYTDEMITENGFSKLDTLSSDKSLRTYSSNDNVGVATWYMLAEENTYSASVFHAREDGYVNLKNSVNPYSWGLSTFDQAEIMIVQARHKNGQEQYYPLWPAKGEWNWQLLPRGSSTDLTGVEIDSTLYMETGDELMLVARSAGGTAGKTRLGSDNNVYFAPLSNDYQGIYPSENMWFDSFVGYQYKVPSSGGTVYRQEAYVKQTVNNDIITSEYINANGFNIMENCVEDSDPIYWTSSTGNSVVKPYMFLATATEYSSVVFHAPETGYIKITNNDIVYTQYSANGAYEPAQIMIVQHSNGGYAPIWPNKESWEWQTVPMRSDANDTSGINIGEIFTYAHENDEIYFVVKSGITTTGKTGLQACLRFSSLFSETDPADYYPTSWSENFEAYQEIIVQPESELATLSIPEGDGEIRRLQKYHPVFLDSDRATPTFNNIPEFLINKSFICTDCWGDSNDWTKTATVEEAGWVYAIATNMNTSNLINDGFVAVPLDIINLFYGANVGTSDNCGLFKKYVYANDTITIYDRWMLVIFDTLENENDYTVGDSFVPPVLVMNGTQEAENYEKNDRVWQGCPGIEQTGESIMYSIWCTGGPYEVAPGNYMIVTRSTDGGNTWNEYMYFVSNETAPDNRTGDAAIFLAPNGSLWIFSLSMRHGSSYGGIWATHTDNPNDENPVWTNPERICPGSLNTDITVLSDGTWVFANLTVCYDTDYTEIWASDDQGQSWYMRGKAYMPDTFVDEAYIVELTDGRLWLTVRSNTDNGICESFSADGGRTWTVGSDAATINGPGSKFAIKRLASGNLLLINHYNYVGRDHISALISSDDGKTWSHSLLLDERKTSYPQVTLWDDNGTEVISVIYDHERYDSKQIYMARFTEQDIISGDFVSDYAVEKQLIDSLSDEALYDHYISWFVQQDTNPYPWGYATWGYFDGDEFKKMESFVETDKYWQSESGNSKITTWRALATAEESPFIEFTMNKSGYLEISEDATNPLQTSGNGQYMIVQTNANGEYCPIYPVKGQWEWLDLSITPQDIGTVKTYLESDDKVYVLYRTADGNDTLIETISHFKFTYASTDTECLRDSCSWTRWLGGGELEENQTAANELMAGIDALNSVTLMDTDNIKQLRNTYIRMTEKQKSLVTNIELLIAAEQKISLLKSGTDTVEYVNRLFAALPASVNGLSAASYKAAAAAYKMLSASEAYNLANINSVEGAIAEYEVYTSVNLRLANVEELITSIPLPYSLIVRADLEKAYGAYKELSESEQNMIESKPLLMALRRITSLMDSAQSRSAACSVLIDLLPGENSITLSDSYDIEYAAGFYNALTEQEKASVSNYNLLDSASNKLDLLKEDSKETTYSITSSVKGGGSIISSGINSYIHGENVVYQIVPFSGAEIIDVLVDGNSVGEVSSYYFSDLGENHTIAAEFTLPDLKIADKYLTIGNDITISFKIKGISFDGTEYENPYIIFDCEGNMITVNNYTFNGQYYIFNLSGIDFSMIDNDIIATLYTMVNGETVRGEEKTFKISEIFDVNGDGETNIKDLVRLKKYAAHNETNDETTDFNGDSLCNTIDLAYIRKVLLVI